MNVLLIVMVAAAAVLALEQRTLAAGPADKEPQSATSVPNLSGVWRRGGLGLFGGFAGTGDRDGAGWRFAARGGRGVFPGGQHRGQVAAAVGEEWQRRGETTRW